MDLAAGEETMLVEPVEDGEVAFAQPARGRDQLAAVHAARSIPSLLTAAGRLAPSRWRIARSTSSTGCP